MKALKLACTAAGLAGMLMVSTPTVASAGLDISSSMVAGCMDASCQFVRFTLSLEPGYGVYNVEVTRKVGSPWTFKTGQGLVASNAMGTLSEQNSATGSIYRIAFQEPWQQTSPFWFVVEMSAAGTAGQLIDGSLTYSGDGFDPVPCDPDTQNCTIDHSFEGTVTPEPISTTLLLTGLAGVAGVHRRRKQKLEV